MDMMNGTEVPEQDKPHGLTNIIDPNSYDVDTPKIDTGAGKRPLRIAGVDGQEIGSGGNAEYFRDGLYSIFGGSPVEVHSDKQGAFGRDLGTLEVEGVDWRHVLYEAGASENWGKYGFDEKGSTDDERYKWYAGKTQATNIEAYELLESGVEPSSIISDKDYNRIKLLRKSFKTHINDGAEGVLDKDDAQAVVRELFADPDLVTAAQKREWYEMARTSNVGESMMAVWKDPFSRAMLERGERTATLDVSPRVDTSLSGMLKNAYNQQFWRSQGGKSVNMETALKEFRGETVGTEDFDRYIADNNIAPDLAADLYDTFEEQGLAAAVEEGTKGVIHRETSDQRNKIEEKSGVSYVASMLFNEATPYLIDPTSWVAGAGTGKLAAGAAQAAFAKVTSPLVQKMMVSTSVGASTGLAESMVFTASNYKDFSNEELLRTWAMDAGFGGAFGALFAAAGHGFSKYAKSAKDKALKEGIGENIYRQADEYQTRMDKMKDEVAQQLQTGEATKVMDEVEVEDVVLDPKPEPVEPEPTTSEGAEPDTTPTKTPEELEEENFNKWQADQMAKSFGHQQQVVQPKLREINEQHNLFAKAHRALGKGLGLQEFAQRMIMHEDARLSYLGTNILETGVGFSGKATRKASAALIKDSIYTKHVGNLNKAYVDNIKGWAMQQGTGKYKQFKAAWEGGKVNDVAKAFHREIFLRQEARQMGKTVPANEYLDNYVTALNRVNDELFQGRIDANIKGFDAERRIANYIPHIWKKARVEQIVKQYDKGIVMKLLEKSIESAQKAGKLTEEGMTVKDLAERQFEWINGLGDSMEYNEMVGAGTSARGKSRIPLDFTVEHNGLSMLDLIDTDVPTVMDSYIQRAGADIGISKATDGLILSEGDFEKFLKPKKESDRLLVQDAQDMLYGRPTRAGMSPELRSLMDLVTIQQMGGIGVAQLAETGTMAQRMVVNYMSEPNIAKRIFKMAGEDVNEKGVLHQVRSIAAVNDNMEYINRYSVNNIDQAQVDELSNLRAASIDAVDKVTLGAYKAQFGRLLGSLSGAHVVQKAQSRLLQSSFAVDVARGFKFGKGSSTQARLADLGLTENGAAARNIRKHVVFDDEGFPVDFKFDQWDKPALDEFSLAMNREEAQLMPRVMAGELPVFMNKPLWQAIMQFRKTPLAFMSKGTQRNLQFADREAALGTVLNAMTAGITRYAKLALAGTAYYAISDEEFRAPDPIDDFDKMQPYNYVSNLGILGDAYTVGQSWSKAAQQKDGVEALWEGAQVVSGLSALDNAYHALDGDPTAIKKAMPLNTLPLVTEVSNAVIRNMEQ